jgi:hypothetical protein
VNTRIVAITACAVVGALVIAGIVVLATGDGPSAATVGGKSISQQYVDDELQELAENKTLSDAIASSRSTPLSNNAGTVTTTVGAGWLGLLIKQEIAARAVAAQGLRISKADRKAARSLAHQAVGGTKIFQGLPDWFRQRLLARWTPVAALARRLTAHPNAAMQQALGRACPSGRYVSHILVESEAEATALKQQLDAGADFATLAKANSIDRASAAGGGALGCSDGQSFVEPFATVAATQPVGVVSDPVTTQYGSHLILVTDTPPPSLLGRVALQASLVGNRGTTVDVNRKYGHWDARAGQVVGPRAPRETSSTIPAG